MDSDGENVRSKRPLANRIGFWAGLVVFFLILLFGDLSPENPTITRMAAIAALMAIWWLTDAIPLAATALLPLALYPLLGIMSTRDGARQYANDTIFLFVGGFLIALAMERWNLHRRIALVIIRAIGGGPARLVLSFMVATAFLSMWISNTATAIMMLAIGLAIISQEEAAFGKEKTRNLAVALLLGIAWSASVGGMATLVGTPPNLAFDAIYNATFEGAPEVSFGQWMLFALPISVVMLALIWFLLTQVLFRSPVDLTLGQDVIDKEYRALGGLRFEELVVLGIFVSTAILWVFRRDLTLGAFSIPGWSTMLPESVTPLLSDGTVAITMALLLFMVPCRRPAPDEEASNAILDLSVFSRLPWHIILLFGGGFALADGFKSTGLSEFVAGGFTGLQGAPPILVIAVICLTITFLTELTSNTATAQMILPILASMAVAMEVHPMLLMVPATLSASCAFMMPVATPPNAIVFGSGRIQIWQMAKAGFVLNLVGVIVITLIFYTLGSAVFGIEPGVVPEWATSVSVAE